MKRIRWARLGCVALATACVALSLRATDEESARRRVYLADVEVTGERVVTVLDERVVPVFDPVIMVLEEPTLEIYDVQDLLTHSSDFLGSYGSGALTPAQLVALIEVATQPAAACPDGVLELHRGQLIVKQTAPGHARVRAVLRALRAP